MMVRYGRFVVAALACAVALPAGAQHAGVDALLSDTFRFSAAELARLHEDEPIARQVPGVAGHEVVVIGAIRVAAPVAALVATLRDIERLESGRRFLATRKLSEPPRLDDFATLRLPDNDLEALRECRPGKCDVKLGQEGFDRLAQVPANAATDRTRLDAMVREIALAYVEGYRRRGNAELPIYLDKARPTVAAEEFAHLVERARVLLDRAPGLAAYLVGFPAHRPERTEDFYYWSMADLGLKPLFRINHLLIVPTLDDGGARLVAATKQLYASHYFHTALEVRLAFDDPQRPGKGHYLVSMTLARADGFTGLFGPIVRAKVRSSAVSGMKTALRGSKGRIEAAIGTHASGAPGSGVDRDGTPHDQHP